MSGIAAYRLVKRKWLDTVFDGEGARRFGGRWNSRGKSCVYLAGSESLALLEVIVHLDDYSLLQHYALLEVLLPEDQVLRLPESDLPGDWRDEPAPPSTAELGDGWLDGQSSLVLAVPSVVVPREWNYLLNPGHPGYERLVAGAKEVNFEPVVGPPVNVAHPVGHLHLAQVARTQEEQRCQLQGGGIGDGGVVLDARGACLWMVSYHSRAML